MSYKQIWETLSKINVNEHCKLLQGLKYLSWSWAWGVLMEHYHDATYEFGDTIFEKDGSATVFCTVQIGDCRREMWLPVMTGGRHAAITAPSSRDISDAKMRCLVKCLAMYGLGFYIYAGEDLPSGEPVKAEPVLVRDPDDTLNSFEIAKLEAELAKLPPEARTAFLEWAGYGTLAEIPGGAFNTCLKGLKAKVKQVTA